VSFVVGIHSVDLSFLLSIVACLSAGAGNINAKVKIIQYQSKNDYFSLSLTRRSKKGLLRVFSRAHGEPTLSPRSAHAQPTLSPRRAHISNYKMINN